MTYIVNSYQHIYYCVYTDPKTNTRHWLLTSDEQEASRTGQSYGLATLDDLYHWAAATGIVFNGIITIFEGHCKWSDETEEYEFID